MRTYFDTSAIVALLLVEPGSARARATWDASSGAVSTCLLHAETMAALAMARRAGRVDDLGHRRLLRRYETIVERITLLDVVGPLCVQAGELATRHSLRGFDAVHLAAALLLVDRDGSFASGDRRLVEAARVEGLSVVLT